ARRARGRVVRVVGTPAGSGDAGCSLVRPGRTGALHPSRAMDARARKRSRAGKLAVAGTPSNSRWLPVAVSLGVGGLVMLPAAAARAGLPPAAATKGIVVTMFSDPGDYIGAGLRQAFDKTNASFGGRVATGG